MAFYRLTIDVLCLIYFLYIPDRKKGHNIFDLSKTKVFLVKYIETLTSIL